ncbi:hypothetical protein CN209_25605, partial [Sinorhizobium meliloti]
GRHHLGIRGRLFLGIGGRDHFGIRGRIASEFARWRHLNSDDRPDRPAANRSLMKVSIAIAPVFLSNAKVSPQPGTLQSAGACCGRSAPRRNFDDGRHGLGDARDGAKAIGWSVSPGPK